MIKLDLHNISHLDAVIAIDEFILKNLEKLPVEIITGNSVDMQKILINIIKKYNLRMAPSHLNNLGSYIITKKI